MNLDDNLLPKDGPITTRNNPIPGYQFHYQNQRDAISGIHLKDFNFSQGNGGTVILGGTANGNGELLIKNAAGSVIVQGDNTGLAIYDGNLTVQNADLTTILDTNGLVSTASFPNEIVTDNTTRTTTNTAATDVPGSTLPSFTLTRTTRAIIFVNILGGNDNFVVDNSTMEILVNDSVDSNLLSFAMGEDWRLASISQNGAEHITGFSVSTSFRLESTVVLVDLSAGTHTMKLQYNVNGSGTAEIDLYEFAYVLLGS